MRSCSGVDMAHFAGLVAAGVHPSPVPHGARHLLDRAQDHRRTALGLINDADLAKSINSNVFPGQQGGPLMHVIAAEGRASSSPRPRSSRTASSAPSAEPGARRPADDTRAAGIDVLTGGTDVHLVLADLRNSPLDGKQAEDALHEVGIACHARCAAAAHGHLGSAHRHPRAGRPRLR